MKITRETQVDFELEDKFWLMYNTAFADLRTASPCRQYMHESEFREEMSDERMLKFVLWEDDIAVAMALVAVDLRAIDWISPEFFEMKYPAHFKEGTIYYFGALLVDPGLQGLHYSELLLAELISFVVRNNGIAAFDCYSRNSEWLPGLIEQMGDKVAVVELSELGYQAYYAIESKGFKNQQEPSTYVWLEK
jgi:GNAT superfamily N-acetyltransferase